MTDMEHSKTTMAWEPMVRPARKRMSAANASGDVGVAMQNWRVSGSYFEVCNCDAPCPCRRLGDKPAGRSLYDTCDFALSWMIKDGYFGATALHGLRAAIAGRWDNAEPPKSGFPAIRPPWHVILYVDDRANPEQRQALEDIFLGHVGGTSAHNYARNIIEVYAIKPARIELDHTPGRERLRIGELVDAATARPFVTAEPMSCGIPGHDHPGRELVASHLRVSDGALYWMLEGRCGFATDFDFRSGD